jgi:hypothetical protein
MERTPEGGLAPCTDLPELAIALAWHRGQLGSEFQTVDGRSVTIVHRGVWSNGLGPDFAEAMVVFDGSDLRTGAVEVHRSSAGWLEHRHHHDPRYDGAVLHVALRDDGVPVRTSAGASVPLVVIDRATVPPLPENGVSQVVWNRFGGDACAEDLARNDPAVVRSALLSLGDRRLAARSARMEAALALQPPADVLWAELLDGLGYAANRDPMRRLAAALPVSVLEATLASQPPSNRLSIARALLFGVSGFLPISPIDAELGLLAPNDVEQMESAWMRLGEPWREAALPATAWTRTRVRPANHPAARLAAAAAITWRAAERGGLLTAVLDGVRDGRDPIAALVRLAAPPCSPGIGPDRAADIAASSILPLALAIAESTGDGSLSDAAARCWESLPAGSPNAVTRRAMRQVAGSSSIAKLGARGAQGLMHLDGSLCAPRRCFECPVAHRVIGAELRTGPTTTG